jgi:hypothetical protein
MDGVLLRLRIFLDRVKMDMYPRCDTRLRKTRMATVRE